MSPDSITGWPFAIPQLGQMPLHRDVGYVNATDDYSSHNVGSIFALLKPALHTAFSRPISADIYEAAMFIPTRGKRIPDPTSRSRIGGHRLNVHGQPHQPSRSLHV